MLFPINDARLAVVLRFQKEITEMKSACVSGLLGGRVALTLFVTMIGVLWLLPQANAGSKAPVFGREVIVDHQRAAGEPSIAIDGQDRVYVAAPFGFSTTASF